MHLASAIRPVHHYRVVLAWGPLSFPAKSHLVAEGLDARNLGKIFLSVPICAILPPARRIGLEKRIVWEILLGQRGSKNHSLTGVAKPAT